MKECQRLSFPSRDAASSATYRELTALTQFQQPASQGSSGSDRVGSLVSRLVLS